MTKNPFPTALIFSGLLVSILLSCGNPKAAQQPHTAMPYPTVEVTKKSVTDLSSYPASIEGVINIQLRAKVPGYIQEVYVDEGQEVRKGQLMFKLETTSLSQDADAAKARVNVAQVEVDKLKPLVDKEIISNVQLETAKANLQQAKSNYQSIVANIDYANIKSPVNGVVGSINFRRGNLVSAQDATPLTTISSIENVYAFFSLNEKDLIGFIKETKGNTLDEKVKNLPEVHLLLADSSPYEQTGKIETISGALDPSTGSVQFRATFPNPLGLLRNGSSATILLPKKMDDVLVVPSLSTFEQQNKKMVYLIQGDTLVPKAVTVTTEVNGISVVQGLKEGDQILAEGVDKVRPGTKIIPQPKSLDSILNSFSTAFK
ncbi:efflux RND transporter periplasmic adaptor subunit [Flavobacteriaceae bacterium F89]|uniref:Efflux RND transporter periplasmic adaptor subunit n=1 Tax=Cerina litoralis TaxID=2874477 RepID=A0AAE3ESG9_9FLAO|nr:efflux RND transporter periplasmic adaptor subunit [Cerina litoralis]MCG2459349.1 efflux RND transporter periplasmic adaptor subunit [Cerina litoralis]